MEELKYEGFHKSRTIGFTMGVHLLGRELRFITTVRDSTPTIWYACPPPVQRFYHRTMNSTCSGVGGCQRQQAASVTGGGWTQRTVKSHLRSKLWTGATCLTSSVGHRAGHRVERPTTKETSRSCECRDGSS
ncbi:hypothetical protein LIA77_11942 [Sarocladium implicatum]|nr:hypothetical protein LIA77_11942 [Sarocladium implicatum]